MIGSRSRLLVAIILYGCAWTALLPDTLDMRDGRKLRGRVVRQDSRSIFFQSQDGTTATLPKSSVRRIVYDKLPDPAEAERKRAEEQKKELTERKKKETARREAAARKAAEERRKKEAEERRQAELKKEQERERERQARDAEEAERRRVEQAKAEAEARDRAAEEKRRREAAERAEAAERERLAREARERRVADEKLADEEKKLIQEVEEATKAEERKEPAAKPPEQPQRPESDRTQPNKAREESPAAKSALFLEAGLMVGEYTPDLEARFLADKFLTALLQTGGIGFNTAWEKKSFRDIAPGLRFETGRWLFGTEIFTATIRPRYYGLVRAGAINIGNATYEPYELESVDATIARDQVSLYGGYEIVKSDPFSLFGLGGLRSIETEGFFESRKFGGSRISSYLPAINATIAGNVNELSRVQAFQQSNAAGPQVGLLGRFRLGQWQVDLGATFFSLEGDTRTRSIETKLSESRAIVSVGSFFSQNFSGSSGEIAYREEAGNLALTGREFTTGLAYRLGPTRRLFLRATRSSATFTDSSVMVWRLNTNPAANPYTLELNGETLYMRDLKFTYPGSAHGETLRALTFGVEQEF